MAREEVCINHPDRPATLRCHQCHKPLCDECQRKDGNGVFCSVTCSQKYQEFRAAYGDKAKPLKVKGGVLKKLIGLIIAVLVVLFVGAKVLKIGVCIKLLHLVTAGIL